MRYTIITLLFCAMVLEVFSLLPNRAEKKPPSVGPPRVQGVIHVHSVFSDGGGTIPEIAQAAKATGMEFVVVTDHNSIDGRQLYQKNHDGVDVYVELEGNTPAGHLLSFSSGTELEKVPGGHVVSESWRQFNGERTPIPGFFLAIAHPSNVKNPWNRFDRYADGIEVINFDSMWQRVANDHLVPFVITVAIAPFNPYLAALRLFHVYEKDTVAWDNMNAISPPHAGFLALDTHEKLKLSHDLILRWPSYVGTFKLGSNVVFLPKGVPLDFENRRKAVYESIQKGRIAMVFHALHPFEGNEFSMKCGSETFHSGDFTQSSHPCSVTVTTPESLSYRAHIRILKDGQLFQESTAATHSVTFANITEPGSYRAEVWLKPRSIAHILLNHDVPYVLYNPIFVR